MAKTLDQDGSSAGFAGAAPGGRYRKGGYPRPRGVGAAPLREKNRRVAMLLVGWIVAMAILSILVIVLR